MSENKENESPAVSMLRQLLALAEAGKIDTLLVVGSLTHGTPLEGRILGRMPPTLLLGQIEMLKTEVIADAFRTREADRILAQARAQIAQEASASAPGPAAG